MNFVIEMQEADTESELDFAGWDLAIVGESLDDRGDAATSFLKSFSKTAIELKYNPLDFSVTFNGSTYQPDAFENTLKSFHGKRVILECSSLGFVEVFLSSRAFYNLKFKEICFLYVEPGNYKLQRGSFIRRSYLLHKRDFELSDEVPGYRAVPWATFMLSDTNLQKMVFFLGYEERRFDRALEDYQMLQPVNTAVVFGVPAFQPGWEMNAFANNIRVIEERNIRGGLHFCGAENPAATVAVLSKIKKGLDDDERMFVAPIGTKPMGIGAALFVAVDREVGLLYDHPKRKPKRSSGVGRWHLYQANF